VETLTLVVAVLTLLLASTILIQLRRVPSRKEVGTLTALVRSVSPKALVEAIESIQPGTSREEVERLIGKPDKPSEDEWVYFLSRDSGYLITFSPNNHVERIRSWKS
jgi:hypothetical protein